MNPVPARTQILGGVTHYWTYPATGPATVSGGDPPPIVMVHGFRGDHHGLDLIARRFPGRRVIVPDLPGFGRSSVLDRPHTIEAFADWLTAFLADVSPERRTTVLGHSFGTIVVAAAAARTVIAERLVLINPIAESALAGPRAIGTGLARFYYWLGRTVPGPAGDGILKNRVIVRGMSIAMAKTREPHLRRWIHDQHDRYFSAFADRESLLQAFDASVTHNVGEYAAKIGVPVLLVAAQKDDITTVAAQRRLQSKFPDASLVVLEGTGHLVHYEAPDRAAAAATVFLAAAAG